MIKMYKFYEKQILLAMIIGFNFQNCLSSSGASKVDLVTEVESLREVNASLKRENASLQSQLEYRTKHAAIMVSDATKRLQRSVEVHQELKNHIEVLNLAGMSAMVEAIFYKQESAAKTIQNQVLRHKLHKLHQAAQDGFTQTE